MPITLPLTLIGVGFFIYLLFAAASYAMPLLAGLSAAFAASHAGAAGSTAMLLGIAVFMAVIAAGRMAGTLMPSRLSQSVIMLLFAVPAAIAAFQVASSFLTLTGGGKWGAIPAVAIAVATAVTAASRQSTSPP